ncbi:hypothetical protein L0128_08715, partial [candidate division KSB1 bacterium]|nr:hypothetical protein [candidate division KSB1 bacterium]
APLAMTPRGAEDPRIHRQPSVSLRGASFCDEAISRVNNGTIFGQKNTLSELREEIALFCEKTVPQAPLAMIWILAFGFESQLIK